MSARVLCRRPSAAIQRRASAGHTARRAKMGLTRKGATCGPTSPNKPTLPRLGLPATAHRCQEDTSESSLLDASDGLSPQYNIARACRQSSRRSISSPKSTAYVSTTLEVGPENPTSNGRMKTVGRGELNFLKSTHLETFEPNNTTLSAGVRGSNVSKGAYSGLRRS